MGEDFIGKITKNNKEAMKTDVGAALARRMEDYLQTENGRQAILKRREARTGLLGKTSIKNSRIPMCIAAVEQLKAISTKPAQAGGQVIH